MRFDERRRRRRRTRVNQTPPIGSPYLLPNRDDRRAARLARPGIPQMSVYHKPDGAEQVYKDPTPLPANVPKVQELGTTSAPLKSAAFFIGAYCKDYNGERLLWNMSCVCRVAKESGRMLWIVGRSTKGADEVLRDRRLHALQG